MQVLVEGSVLPPALTTTPLTRVRMRRGAFAEDPAFPTRSIDCELRLGSTPVPARHLTSSLVSNRPANLTVAAARRTYSVPATPALGPGDAIGADLIDLPLDAPFTFAGPNLFLEWRNLSPSLDVSAGHWVDAVQVNPAADLGLALLLGTRGCGTIGGALAMSLVPDTMAPPALGVAFPLVLRNALPTAPGVLMAGLEPLQRPPFGLAFGQDLSVLGMPGCWLWAGADVTVSAAANAQGAMRAELTLPNVAALRSSQVSVQAVTPAPGQNVLGLATSSGVMLRPDFVGVFDRAVTVLDHRIDATLAAFPPFLGLTPVLLLGL